MHLCYLDESGTPEVPGTTSHYILAGLSIPIEKWKQCESDIAVVKDKYDLKDKEIHTGWILRPYAEQGAVKNFSNLSYAQRRIEVNKVQNANLLKLQKMSSKRGKYNQLKKTYRLTKDYIHLTRDERELLIEEIAKVISKWNFARLFAECIDKIHFINKGYTIDEQAFEQVVSRFEAFLRATGRQEEPNYGIMIHDNNETVAKRHTALMNAFHKSGTFWREIKCIIETPLFVDSSLTSMIQIADLCSYALRKYCEDQKEKLFNLIYKRADKKDGIVVGIRHFCNNSCACKICTNHKRQLTGDLFPSSTTPPTS